MLYNGSPLEENFNLCFHKFPLFFGFGLPSYDPEQAWQRVDNT